MKRNDELPEAVSPTPKVSVILPVFNGESVVAESIQSVVDQTFTDWELLIGDDGSTDRTVEICEEFARRDSRVRFVRHDTNTGVGATRNRLIALARAPFLAFQDADDVSAPERFAKELEVFEQHPKVGIVSGMAAWLDDDGRVFFHHPWVLRTGRQFPTSRAEMVQYLYVRGNKIVMPAAMVRRDGVNSLEGPFDPLARQSGDWQFFLRLAHVYRCYGIPEDLVRMRRGSRNASLTSDKERLFAQSRRCLRVILKDYRHDPQSPIRYSLYLKAMSNQLFWEARWYGFRGVPRLLRALAYNPSNVHVWKYGRNAVRRRATKLLHRIGIGRGQPADGGA